MAMIRRIALAMQVLISVIVCRSSSGATSSCRELHELPKINKPLVLQLPVSWDRRYLCLTMKPHPHLLMTVLNFDPVECVKFPQLNSDYIELPNGDMLFQLEYKRDPACVGIKGNTTQMVKAAVAARKGIKIGGQIVAAVIYEVYLPLLLVSVAISFILLRPWLRTTSLFELGPGKCE